MSIQPASTISEVPAAPPEGRPQARLLIEEPEIAIDTQQLHAQENNNPIGVYGWRKRCLYFFVLLLVVVLIVNLGLTVWILVVLHFNANGMGSLRITDSGLRLDGTADFIGPLYAQNISADQNSSLLVQSDTTMDINVGGVSSIAIDNDSLNVTTPSFNVFTNSASSPTDPTLSVSNEGVSIVSNQLNVRGTLGVSLSGPLEAPQVISPPSEDLELISPSGQVRLVGSGGVRIEDGVAFRGIEVSSDDDVTITSQSGSVILDGQNINVPNLRRTSPGEAVYEVCACSTGELYLVPASSNCGNDSGLCT